MSPQSSKVIIVEEEPRVRGIPSTPTSIAAAVGVAERGPIGEPLLVSSFEEFERHFGGFTPSSDLALAAVGFFENGGAQLWVVRTVHYGDISDANSATALRAVGDLLGSSQEPTPAAVKSDPIDTIALPDGGTLMLQEGLEPPMEANVTATSASLSNTGIFPSGFAGGEVLILNINGQEQSVFFQDGDQSAEQITARMNEQLRGVHVHLQAGQVEIHTDEAGTQASIQVLEGGANSKLIFPVELKTGGGNVALTSAVTRDELVAIFTVAFAPRITVTVEPDNSITLKTVAVGPVANLNVDLSSSLSTLLGFDTDFHTGAEGGFLNTLRVEGKDPGAYANQIQLAVSAATDGDPQGFDLAVIEDGVYREVFNNLSMLTDAPRYAPSIINNPSQGSALIQLIDLEMDALPIPQLLQLAGGDDGLTDLDDNDFIGSDISKTGMRALDTVQEISILIIPGRASSAVHNAMVSYCEGVRGGSLFAILDPPSGLNAPQMIEYVTQTAALSGLSEHAAIYWPRLEILNPSKATFGSTSHVTVPPSGIIAGVFARTDAARPGGVYEPPAGVDKGRMFGVLGFETKEVLEERKRDLIYPKRINPLTTSPGLPRFIDGSRTLKGDGNFPYIAERRGVSFIERSLKQGLQFARHKNNTEGLRAQVRRTTVSFLLTQMNNGAFRSREPSKAFFVDVSEALNTPTNIFAGKLIARVGLAPHKPAEFIIVMLSADTRALEAELAAG